MLVTRQMMRVMSLQPHAPHDYRVTADALWAAALSIKETELKSHLQKQLKTDMYSMQQIETATELWNSMLEIKNLVVRVSRGGRSVQVAAESGQLIMHQIWQLYRDTLSVLYPDGQPPENSPFGSIDDLVT